MSESKGSDNEGYILGVGNPLLDISSDVEEDFLNRFNFL